MNRGNTKHGLSHTNFYYIYKAMMNRCYWKKSKNYKNYGGRGITVDARWHTFESFRDDMYVSYLAHRATHPGLGATSIDRINNSLGYSATNCRWADRTEQATNRRMPMVARNTRLTPRQVVNILHCKGSISELKLANLYGVSATTIGDIWRRKTWNPLPVGKDYYMNVAS